MKRWYSRAALSVLLAALILVRGAIPAVALTRGVSPIIVENGAEMLPETEYLEGTVQILSGAEDGFEQLDGESPSSTESDSAAPAVPPPPEPITDGIIPDETLPEGALPGETLPEYAVPDEAAQDETDVTTEESLPEETMPEELPPLYQDGRIIIHTFEQLKLIGTGVMLTSTDFSAADLGLGDIVADEYGAPVVYGPDRLYSLAADIPLPAGTVWQLPEGFTGAIAPMADPAEEPPVYDDATGMVYLYHPFQLIVIASENAANEPVTRGDATVENFGRGQFIFPNGEELPFLTYDPARPYALSAGFNSDMSALPSSAVKEEETAAAMLSGGIGLFNAAYDGRDYPGQVVKKINGIDYILIGNGQQLQAIGTGAPVRRAVYQIIRNTEFLQPPGEYTVDTHEDGSPIMLYNGDADLKPGETLGLVADPPPAVEIPYVGGTDYDGRVASMTNGSAEMSNTNTNPDSGLTYEANGHYIIFRNFSIADYIATGTEEQKWNPLMFSGTMIGAAPNMSGKIWTNPIIMDEGTEVEDFSDATGFADGVTRPTISGVTINHTHGINDDVHRGIGFFGTISSATDEVVDSPTFMQAGDQVSVSNIKLEVVSIGNTSTEYKQDNLIGALLGNVTGLVDGLLERAVGPLLEGLLGIELTEDLLTDLLGADENPTDFATGAFAGKVLGNVEIKDCEVAFTGNSTLVQNVMGYTGGFAGYVAGVTEYDGLSKLLGALVQLLSDILDLGGALSLLDGILNIIPGLGDALSLEDLVASIGLGELITVLLGQGGVLDVGALIPTGYTAPRFIRCGVTNASGTIGSTASDYAGGFAGYLEGAYLEDCAVNGQYNTATAAAEPLTTGALTIAANQYGGGFAGAAIDGQIGGLLSGALGVGLGGVQYDSNGDGKIDSTDTTVPNDGMVDADGDATNGNEKYAGISTASVNQNETMLLGCVVGGTSLTVQGPGGGDYLGGFTGALAHSYAIQCLVDVDATLTVDGANYAGGFAGTATVGWLLNLGQTTNNRSVVNKLSGVLGGLLGAEGSGPLLSLLGASPSAIMSSAVSAGTSITIGAEDPGMYAGGLVGKADGARITPATGLYLDGLSYFSYANTAAFESITPCSISGLASVTATSYAGGIGGYMGAASEAALLNSTLGLGEFIGFKADGVTVNGGGGTYSVSTDSASGTEPELPPYPLPPPTAPEEPEAVAIQPFADGTVNVNEPKGYYAGGAFGALKGGEVTGVRLHGLASVAADNMAGGFAGLTGPGTLANAGLSLNLLGLNRVLDLSNLLAVVASLGVTVNTSSVNDDDAASYSVTVTKPSGGSGMYAAGGFIGWSGSTQIEASFVEKLESVSVLDYTSAADTPVLADGGYAGGFVGVSRSGNFVDTVPSSGSGLLEVNGLLALAPTVVPSYEDCKVTYADAGGAVRADVAGGFVGDMQSGKVTRTYTDGVSPPEDAVAVQNIAAVTGKTYAGGFGGKVYSGAFADAGGGLSLLGDAVEVTPGDLLSLFNTYVPEITNAGVASPVTTADSVTTDLGFTVEAMQPTGTGGDPNAGSAGGFAGYASGAQIDNCDVTKLASTNVAIPRAANGAEDLESTSGDNYFNLTEGMSSYAVTGGRYAGGFIGKMDIGSAVATGEGLSVLDKLINVDNLLSIISATETAVTSSDVTGAAGGFAVLASNGLTKGGPFSGVAKGTELGMAGGFVGASRGGVITGSNVKLFSHVIGQIAAGGYAGWMEPGNLASVANGSTGVLGALVQAKGLLDVLQVFLPSITSSSAYAVPCGAIIRAEAETDGQLRGVAGGYVGYNVGGTIAGTGEEDISAAVRIASVYGREYAGGFAGLMEAADAASAGSLSLLGGLAEIENLLGALGVIYPTHRYTAVYGPLKWLDGEGDWLPSFNDWLGYVGKNGGYGWELAYGASSADIASFLETYGYGYSVKAGRGDGVRGTYPGGDAGGYVGLMSTGTVENSSAYGAAQISALHSAGGFAGQIRPGELAALGSVKIGGVAIDLGELLGLAPVIVPTIEGSSVEGYQSGLTVRALGGITETENVAGTDTAVTYNHGYAGGFVGVSFGGQLAGVTNVTNLRRVSGRNAVGGFAGRAASGAVAGVDTNAGSGLLQGLLDFVVGDAGKILSVLQSTGTTIGGARVSSVTTPNDPMAEWGFVIDGIADTAGMDYPRYAGGFAGSLEASALESEASQAYTVDGLRSVEGDWYAGGFFGYADVGSVAEVGSGETSILGLIGLGQVNLLSVFQTSISNAEVNGVDPQGVLIKAHGGSAGGFGGTMMSGTLTNCTVNDLATVEGANYTGGFAGHLGKGAVLGVDNLTALNALLDLSASLSALGEYGTTVTNCHVNGYRGGMVVQSGGGTDPIAGGFVGYADISAITASNVTELKMVESDGIAGGYAGKTDMGFLINLTLGVDEALDPVLVLVDGVLNLIHEGITPVDGVLSVNTDSALQASIASVNSLLGLGIANDVVYVSLSESVTEGMDNVALIMLGTSYIRVGYTVGDGGALVRDAEQNVEIKLLETSDADVSASGVTGVSTGYDVTGGSAAGGFAGLNLGGKLSGNTMDLCDVIEGAEQMIGPFTGLGLMVRPDGDRGGTTDALSGAATPNTYHIYRKAVEGVTYGAITIGGKTIPAPVASGAYYVYTAPNDFNFAEFDGVDIDATHKLGVYGSPSRVVLMLDTLTNGNPNTADPEPGEVPNPCFTFVPLIIQKVWEDLNENTRPESIAFTITQTAYNADGNAITTTQSPAFEPEVTIKKNEQYAANSDTWRKSVPNMPVTLKDADGKVLEYYTYTITEAPVENYTTGSVDYNPERYSFKVTNTHTDVAPAYPNTGGGGDVIYILSGVSILLFAAVLTLTRGKGNLTIHARKK